MKIYWTEGDKLLGCWNEATGAITYAYYGNPELAPNDYSGYGSTAILGDGTIVVGRYHSSAGGNPVVYLYNPDLTFNSFKEMSHYTASIYAGYINYMVVSGIYDPATGRNWFTFTKNSEGYKLWTAYDNTMTFAESFRDVAVESTLEGDTVYGATQLNPHNVYQRGRLLIRGMPNGSGFTTTDLDTGVLKGALFDYTNVRIWGGHDDVGDKFVVVNGTTGLFEVYNFSSVSWHTYNPDTPNGTYLPAPDFTLDPSGPGGPSSALLNANSSGVVKIYQGWIYYWAQYTYNVDYGYDDANQNYGNATSLYRIEIATGTIEKVFDVPFVSIDIYGNQFTDGNSLDWETDTFSGNERGLSIVASATNIGQLYVNLSTTQSTPNWVSVCGGTSLTTVEVTSPVLSITAGTATVVGGDSALGSHDGDGSYVELYNGQSYSVICQGVSIPSNALWPGDSVTPGVAVGFRHMSRQLADSTVSESGFSPSVSHGGGFFNNTPGNRTTTYAEYSQVVAFSSLTGAATNYGSNFQIDIAHQDTSPGARMTFFEMVFRYQISTASGLGYFNTNPAGVTWTQVHLGNFHADAAVSGAPVWYTCCSHAP